MIRIRSHLELQQPRDQAPGQARLLRHRTKRPPRSGLTPQDRRAAPTYQAVRPIRLYCCSAPDPARQHPPHRRRTGLVPSGLILQVGRAPLHHTVPPVRLCWSSLDPSHQSHRSQQSPPHQTQVWRQLLPLLSASPNSQNLLGCFSAVCHCSQRQAPSSWKAHPGLALPTLPQQSPTNARTRRSLCPHGIQQPGQHHPTATLIAR